MSLTGDNAIGIGGSVRCPVHGVIDLRDETEGTDIIRRLVVSAPLQRLRRVKQLGFASLEYSGADHSRFSHAIGTLEVMRRLLRRFGATNPHFFAGLLAEIGVTGRDSAPLAMQHLLVAALLQDCGELPYAQSMRSLLRPDDDTFRAVAELIDEPLETVRTWPNKPVFTIACLVELQATLESLDLVVLAYLITGHHWTAKRERLHAVMQLLDGVVDADRIDYVARDTHHTGLGKIDVAGVIGSLVDVHDDGPLCIEPAPVAELLAMRAHLYSTVYLSGANRFRVLLLRELLKAVLDGNSQQLRVEVFGEQQFGHGVVTFNHDRFMTLDDVTVDGLIELAATARSRNHLSRRGKAALDGLRDPSLYRERWFSSLDPLDSVVPVNIPPTVFAEYYEDASRSDQRLVRVRMGDGDTAVEIPLNELNGPYASITTRPRAELPMRGDVLIFEPKTSRLPSDYQAALDSRSLGAAVKAGLVQGGGIDRPDTLDDPDYSGPSLFISYCVEDIWVVAAIVGELKRRKRKYYLLAGAHQGVGGTPGENSRDAPRRADACLMVVSVAYQDRILKQPNGNIVKELEVAAGMRRISGYPIVPLATSHFSTLSRMPWGLLGFDETPFVGRPLSAHDRNGLAEAVNEALRRIDEEVEKKK